MKPDLIENTISKLKELPENKLQEVEDYIDFLLRKIDDSLVQEQIQKQMNLSSAFEFLEDEEDLYKISDLKKKYK